MEKRGPLHTVGGNAYWCSHQRKQNEWLLVTQLEKAPPTITVTQALSGNGSPLPSKAKPSFLALATLRFSTWGELGQGFLARAGPCGEGTTFRQMSLHPT